MSSYEGEGHLFCTLKTLLTLVRSVDGGSDSILSVTRLLELLLEAPTSLANGFLHSLALSLQTGSHFYFFLL